MKNELKELFKSIVIAVLATFLIITFIFQTVSVDGTSMVNTLHNRDRLIVEKVSYYFRSPKLGDIIVFKYPKDQNEKYIKRVIGVAGDKVRIEKDHVYVNGKLLVEPYAYFDNSLDNNDPRVHYMDEVVVPKNTVFVLGDDRYNSSDSRFMDRVGFVDKKLIIGRAALRIYPFSDVGRIE
ncbi:MAG: signal peptidase I [Bacillota bacterium]|nr:signal peptidase I [Bacillota bacterium]